MAWKKVSAELCAVLEDGLAGFACEKRKMFGCPAYFVNGNMFAGVHQDDIMVRLSNADREAILTTFDEAAPFEPMDGRVMKEYVVVPEALYGDKQVFNEWLRRSQTYTLSLPPKEPKPKKKR